MNPQRDPQITDDAPPRVVAAVDLGSNSFHMLVARIDSGLMQVTDRLKEMVRLGEGLTSHKDLTPEVAERAIGCLERFAQRLRDFPAGSVRAVGTNTLRQLSPASDFIPRAEAALGHPIEIIAGREEARLIYLGVAHDLAAGKERRMVIDIGGGSTEIIVGVGFSPRLRESLHMGCVSMSQRHFAEGRISARAMEKAELSGALEVRPVREMFRRSGWQTAVGSSGTIRAIAAVVQAEDWCQHGISAKALLKLRETLIDAGHLGKLDLAGLSEERKPVFAGGVAVLRSIFESLQIEHLEVSEYALREGVIYEMMGRREQDDVREHTILRLSRHFQVDQGQAQRVRNTARWLLEQAAAPWSLTDPELALMLDWSARLHEIGLMVAHSQYQRHGAYLLHHADLAGFTRAGQQLLATLVLGHRRRFPVQEVETLPRGARENARRLCILLRLSVLLHRGRSCDSDPRPSLTASGDHLALRFPGEWLAQHPLTRLELEQETERLATSGFRLEFS